MYSSSYTANWQRLCLSNRSHPPDEAHGDGAVYEITVPGGYYFDDYLAQGGGANDAQLISFITSRITKGIFPMEIGESDIGCSSFTAVTEDNEHTPAA